MSEFYVQLQKQLLPVQLPRCGAEPHINHGLQLILDPDMARSPILNRVSILVSTGTTLNIAADRIHPIGSPGISH
eukprot:6185276-Pleurochrysis_carterae.AAC.1